MNPDNSVDPRERQGGPDGGSTVTPTEYARLTGLHVRTVRERIRRGELAAARVQGRHGPEYRIAHPDSPVAASVDPAVIAGDSHGASSVDPRPHPDGLGALVDLVERQQQTILELSGRLGWLQAQLAERDAKTALLEAPAPAPAEMAAVEATNHPAPVENGPRIASERARSASKRPWWAFWRPVTA